MVLVTFYFATRMRLGIEIDDWDDELHAVQKAIELMPSEIRKWPVAMIDWRVYG